MQGPQFVFILLPCIAALAVGWGVRHWALAAAVFFGCVGGLYTVPLVGGDARFVAPLLTGGALAAMITFMILRIRPEISLWTKMTITLAITFVAHFAFLQYALANR